MEASDYTVVLRPGEFLSHETVSCPSGEFTLVHQPDGRLVIHRQADGYPVWVSGTGDQDSTGEGSTGTGRFELRPDGTPVVLGPDGALLWSGKVSSVPISAVVMHNAGRMMTLDEDGYVRWQTDAPPAAWERWHGLPDGRSLRRGQNLTGHTLTSANGRFALVNTRDGAVFLQRAGGDMLWGDFSRQYPGLALSEEGNLGSRRSGGYFSMDNGIGVPPDLGAFEMYVSDDGRITFADEAGQVIWQGPLPEPPASGTPEAPGAEERREEVVPHRSPVLLDGCDRFDVLVVRTDFGDEVAWQAILGDLREPVNGQAEEDDAPEPFVIEDRAWEGARWEEIVPALPDEGTPEVLFVADREAMAVGHPLLAVNVALLSDAEDAAPDDAPPQTGRVGARQASSMAVNLALANMDFEDFTGRG